MKSHASLRTWTSQWLPMSSGLLVRYVSHINKTHQTISDIKTGLLVHSGKLLLFVCSSFASSLPSQTVLVPMTQETHLHFIQMLSYMYCFSLDVFYSISYFDSPSFLLVSLFPVHYLLNHTSLPLLMYAPAHPSDHYQLQTPQCNWPSAYHDDVLGLGWRPARRI